MKKRVWILKPIGELILETMEKRGMDLPTLAEVTGLSRGYLSDLTKGKADNPSLEVLVRIATALAVDLRIPGQQLAKAKGKVTGLVYESEFRTEESPKEEREVIDLETTEAVIDNPAVRRLARLLGDKAIPLQTREKIEKYTIELVEWMAQIIRNQEENSK